MTLSTEIHFLIYWELKTEILKHFYYFVIFNGSKNLDVLGDPKDFNISSAQKLFLSFISSR